MFGRDSQETRTGFRERTYGWDRRDRKEIQTASTRPVVPLRSLHSDRRDGLDRQTGEKDRRDRQEKQTDRRHGQETQARFMERIYG